MLPSMLLSVPRSMSRRPLAARRLRAAGLLAGLAACHDPAEPPVGRLPALEVVRVDSLPPLPRIITPDGTLRARLTLDRVAAVPEALGRYMGTEITGANVVDLDFVRWSPDGRSIAATASTILPRSTAVVLVFDLAGDSTRAASMVGYYMGAMDWSPDGRRIAYESSFPRGRSSTYGVGFTDLAAGRSEVLFVSDTLTGRNRGLVPESVRWSTGGEIYFGVWRRDAAPAEAPSEQRSTLYAIDPATRRLRIVRDSVPGKVVEIARAGDFALLLRTAPGDPAPPSWPDYRRLVRFDLATGRETVLLDGPPVRAARLTSRDEYVLVTLNGGLTTEVTPTTRLVYDLLTPTGTRLGTVARGVIGSTSPLWGSQRVDVRVR